MILLDSVLQQRNATLYNPQDKLFLVIGLDESYDIGALSFMCVARIVACLKVLLIHGIGGVVRGGLPLPVTAQPAAPRGCTKCLPDIMENRVDDQAEERMHYYNIKSHIVTGLSAVLIVAAVCVC